MSRTPILIEIEEKHIVDQVPSVWTDFPSIPIIENGLKYNVFFENHLLTNKPCIIKSISDSWECSMTWISNTKDAINYDYLRSEYGCLNAPVADCNTLSFNAHCKNDMKVSEYITYIRDQKTQLLYLKDWHLKRNRPDHNFYEVPQYFSSDWLNEYALDHGDDDFMFVYIGPSQSWTPLHADVYSSYSWSVNIIGLKKWILFPPGEEIKLKDKFGNLPSQFNAADYKNVVYLEVYQKKGDAIFVPSGWYHQVVNIENTISINHNWFNGCNIHVVWEALEENFKLVENEINEFRETPEFRSQCQLMLKSLFGMDHECFLKLLKYIGKKRLLQLEGNKYLIFDKFIYGINCIKYDLKCILNILNIIVEKIDFYKNIITSHIMEDLINLKHTITQVL